MNAMPDIGLTHVALTVSNAAVSASFYAKYANMRPVHERPGVMWITDGTRPFVIVLIETKEPVTAVLPDCHLGVALESVNEVDRLAALAREEGCLLSDPKDSGPVIGYWCYLRDPDGHTLEISYGQQVGLAVHGAR